MDEKISVILPTYNGEQNIKKSIESIIHQTYSNWELILVNDCSTDNTQTILESYAIYDNRISVINNDINQRLPRSLNIGFSHATGSLLTWTSDDNIFHPNAFQTMYNVLHQNPDIDLVYTDFNVVDLNGTLLWHESKENPDALRFRNVIGACFLYRRSLADKIGIYDPELFLAEDYEYWIRAFLNGNLYHLCDTLYDYGWHEKSLTSTRKAEIAKATFLAQLKHFDALLNKCTTQEDRNNFFWSMLSSLSTNHEIKYYRKLYYKLDKKFAIRDIKKRLLNLIMRYIR